MPGGKRVKQGYKTTRICIATKAELIQGKESSKENRDDFPVGEEASAQRCRSSKLL